MLAELALSAALSIIPPEHEAQLKSLQRRLAKEGYDISAYLKDERFEIYEPNGKPQDVNYADTTEKSGTWYMRHDSIERCADFVEEYWYWLRKAEKEYGPSPEHITSQLELETNRGQYLGERPVINSMITMYVTKPGRREEFYKYLKGFLDLQGDTTDNIVFPQDIFEAKGSWAGAYGVGQGMPKMIREYGEDFDGDGVFDPRNIIDGIGFVARHLDGNGFRKNPRRATQGYNPGDDFYESSIGKHTLKLKEELERRSREPPERIYPKLPDKLNFTPLLDTSLRSMRPTAAETESIYRNNPNNKPRRGFISRIVPRIMHR
jgi:membrane-bound lytic murein transglycosylase B